MKTHDTNGFSNPTGSGEHSNICTQTMKIVLLQPRTAAAGMKFLELRTVSTYPTGLRARGFTALPESSSIVVSGQSAEHAPWALYQYKLEGGRLQQLRQVKWPCEHVFSDGILGVIVEGQELLAVACKSCGDIKLTNLETGETHVAYSSEKKPYKLCHGEAGRMWVHCRGDPTLRELSCNSKTFTETGRTVNTVGDFFDICYLPAPHRALVLSHGYWMEAISCETGQQLWRLEGDFDGKKIAPWGLTLHPELRLLLVADPRNNRILVLDPETRWSPLQTFPSPDPWRFCWSRGRLLMWHPSHGRQPVSYLQLVDPKKGKVHNSFVMYVVMYGYSGQHRSRSRQLAEPVCYLHQKKGADPSCLLWPGRIY